MTREIKFRAWDKKRKRMFVFSGANYLSGINFSNNKSLHSISKIKVHNNDTGGIEYVENGEFELMQYTGLKDYHKKEIYEGDIVRFTFKNGYVEYTDEVIKNMWEIRDHCWEKGIDYSDIEVIGNIYETPKLKP